MPFRMSPDLWHFPQRLWERLLEARLWSRPWVFVAGAVAVIGLALGIVVWATAPWGPWANSDGLTYLVMARGMYRLQGPGYPTPDGGFRFVTHFPPGYPTLIALFMPLTQGDPARAAQLLHLVAVALLLALAMGEVRRWTQHPLPALALGLWLAVAYPMQRFFTGVFSEVPFLVLVLAAAWAGQARRPILAGVLSAVAVYVRWIGVALIPWLAGVFWWQARQAARGAGSATFPQKAQRKPGAYSLPLRYLAASLLPVAGLMLLNRLLGGSAISRKVLWHPPGPRHWAELRATLALWGRPNQLLWNPDLEPRLALFTALTALGLLAWGLVLARRQGWTRLLQGMALWLGFILAYGGTVLGAITLVDYSTSLDTRILLPVFLAGSLVLSLAGWAVARRYWWAGLALGWAVFTLSRYHFHYDQFQFRLMRQRGGILRDAWWQQADMWPVLRSLPPEVPLYSPEFPEVLYYADRATGYLAIPGQRDGQLVYYDPVQRRYIPLSYPSIDAWLEDLAQSLRGRCAVIVIPTLQPELRQTREAQYRLLRRVFPLWKALQSGYLLLSDAQACNPLLEKP